MTSNAPIRLRRKDAADYLTNELGIPCSVATLAKLAWKGSEPGLGPRYRKFGGTVLYEKADLEAWANERLTRPVTTTRELKLEDV